MKYRMLCLGLLFCMSLLSMKTAPITPQGQASFSITRPEQQYQPLPLKKAIADLYSYAGKGCHQMARITAVNDYNDPDIKYYAGWKKHCEDKSHEWATRETWRFSVYNADLKDPKQVAGLGLGATVATLVVIKILNWAIDCTWHAISQQSKK